MHAKYLMLSVRMLISMRMKMDTYSLLYIGMIHDHKNGKVNYSHEKEDHAYLYFMLDFCLG